MPTKGSRTPKSIPVRDTCCCLVFPSCESSLYHDARLHRENGSGSAIRIPCKISYGTDFAPWSSLGKIVESVSKDALQDPGDFWRLISGVG